MDIRRFQLHTFIQFCDEDCEPRSCSWKIHCYRPVITDLVVFLICLAAVVGSICLMAGLILLCLISKSLQDRTSEAILLMGIGLFISVITGISWQLTNTNNHHTSSSFTTDKQEPLNKLEVLVA